MNQKKSKILIYAPNIHSGGGAVLLESLLKNLPSSVEASAILDIRYSNSFKHLNLQRVNILYWVYPNIVSRFFSEIKLINFASFYETLLCLHNIPPILCKHNNILVYFQNRIIIDNDVKKITTLSTKINIIVERAILRLFSKNVKIFFCQTETIRSLLKTYLSKNIGAFTDIQVAPFAPELRSNFDAANVKKKWDFIYISSGDPHKNHLNLVEAWKILKVEGVNPSLAITLRESDIELLSMINSEAKRHSLNIQNIGWLNKGLITSTLLESGALIFPSFLESFGLPLVEARNLNVPILAPEIDYVRDVCVPTETFDPSSPKSISRAVRRHLKLNEILPKINTPEEFIKLVLGKQ